MTVYNGTRHLREAVESVLAQSVAVHLCIVDDGSTDGSAELLAQYAARAPKQICVLTNPRNEGIGRALSRALACQADEDYFAMIGQDDIWSPDFLKNQIVCLTENNAIAAFGAVQMIDGTGASLSGSRFACFDHARLDRLCREELLPELIHGNFLCAASCTVDLCKLAGEPLRGLFGMSNDRLQDWECWLNLCLRGTFVYNSEARIFYRSHSNNFSDPRHRWLQVKLEHYSALQRTLCTDAFWKFLVDCPMPIKLLSSVLTAVYDQIAFSNPCRLVLMSLCEAAIERGYDMPEVRSRLAEMYQEAGMLSKAYRVEGNMPLPIPLTFSTESEQAKSWIALEQMGLFSLQPPNAQGAILGDMLMGFGASTREEILSVIEDNTAIFRDGILDSYPVRKDQQKYLEELRRNGAVLDSKLYKLLRRFMDWMKRWKVGCRK